jgi:hypothetical protein
MGNNSFWVRMLDDAAVVMFSILPKNKSDSSQHVITFLQKMKDGGTHAK